MQSKTNNLRKLFPEDVDVCFIVIDFSGELW
jgi:hypothetical protein